MCECLRLNLIVQEPCPKTTRGSVWEPKENNVELHSSKFPCYILLCTVRVFYFPGQAAAVEVVATMAKPFFSFNLKLAQY